MDEQRRDSAGRREHVIFAAAVGVVLLHVLVDAFVALEPGVRPADHLVPGLVPAVLLVLAAWLYRRLRPGLRAALALCLAALASVGGGLALSHVRLAGPAAADDWTGLLLLPAAVVLALLGARVLWVSRRPDGHRYVRRALIAVVVVVAAFELVLPVAMAIVATHRVRKPAEMLDFGRPSQLVHLQTSDGLTLAAQYVPSQNHAAVITFPREWTAGQAKLLAARGYGVLMLDMRGYGDSEGDANAFGWGAVKDLYSAVAWLRARPDVEDSRVGGIGLSVGGEQLLEAAAGEPGLAAVVSEGAGERSMRETLLYGLRGLPSLPMGLVQTTAIAVLSGHAPPPSLKESVARISPRPVFLIYAGRGGGGEELQPQYYAAAGRPKSIWKIAESGHTGGLRTAPYEYERRVLAFFDAALLAGR